VEVDIYLTLTNAQDLRRFYVKPWITV